MTATAAQVLAALRRRYGRDKGWATFTEVTTADTNRRADAIAVNLWTNSRDHQIHGFEVKVARSDWLAELKNPDKSDYFRARCTYWWIVSGPDVVKVGEVPPTWGHLVLNGDVIRLAKQAQANAGAALDDAMMTVLLRHAFDAAPSKELLQAERNLGYQEGLKRAEEMQASTQRFQQSMLSSDFEEWQRVRPAFEKASGVHLTSANAELAGRAYGIIYRALDRERDAMLEMRAAERRLELLLEQQRRAMAEASKILTTKVSS